MSDIVDRLRGKTMGAVQWVAKAPDLCIDAADEIDRLRADIRDTYKQNCGRDFEHLPLPAAVAMARQADADEIERLHNILRECRSLLDDGVLVRDITQDDLRITFLRQGMRVAAFVSALNEAVGDD